MPMASMAEIIAAQAAAVAQGMGAPERIYIDEAANISSASFDQIMARVDRAQWGALEPLIVQPMFSVTPPRRASSEHRMFRTGNNRLVSHCSDSVCHFLYATEIVTRWKGGNCITLRSGGYMTALTKSAMNEVLLPLGIKVFQYDGDWFVENKNVRPTTMVPFVDGMTIQAGPVFTL